MDINLDVPTSIKTCSQCGIDKSTTEFRKNKYSADGLQCWCRQCYNIYKKQWRNNNPGKSTAEKRRYRNKYPDKVAAVQKEWRSNNPERVRLLYERWKENNSEYNSTRGKEYKRAHKEQIRVQKRNYKNNKWKSDIKFKLSEGLRSRLRLAIKGGQKSGSAVRDLGCSIEDLKLYLESKFQPGMTWDNWSNGEGKWNIDHIKPLSKFDLTDREQFLKACHYTNLQPMWWIDNMKKRDKFQEEHKNGSESSTHEEAI